jgi:hypothetical protein
MATAPRWTPDEDLRLAQHGRGLDGTPAWIDIAAAHFPGRSGWACRQRYLTLRKRAAGISYADQVVQRKATVAKRKGAALVLVVHATASRVATEHDSLTAAFFGDPPRWRSALDAMRVLHASPGCKGHSRPLSVITLPKSAYRFNEGETHASDH